MTPARKKRLALIVLMVAGSLVFPTRDPDPTGEEAA